MSKALEVSKSQAAVLFNQAYTGFDLNMSESMYPPVVNVLQSDKQFKAFPAAKNSELVDHYGKLFVRNDNNTPEDLKESITGTVIKIEQGHEVRDPDENKIISSDSRMLSKEEKEEYFEKGLKPNNMVKILLALGSAEEVGERLAVYKQKMEEGTASREDFPFGVVVIKGTSWGSWLEATDEMDKMAREALNKSFKEVLAPLFKFKVGSKKEKGTFGEYFSVTITPEFNSIEEATAYAPYLMEMKDIGLFYKVSERVEDEDKRAVEAVFADMDDGDEDKGDKLPF